MNAKTNRPKLTPFQKIMRAAKKGRGIRLTANEVFQLSRDDAIATAASNDDEQQRGTYGGFDER